MKTNKLEIRPKEKVRNSTNTDTSGALQMSRSKKFCKISKKTPALKSLF